MNVHVLKITKEVGTNDLYYPNFKEQCHAVQMKQSINTKTSSLKRWDGFPEEMGWIP